MFVFINFTSISNNIIYFIICFFFFLVNFSNDFVYVLGEKEVSVRYKMSLFATIWFCSFCPLMILTIIFFSGDLRGMSFNGETNRSPMLKGKNNQKVAGSF